MLQLFEYELPFRSAFKTGSSVFKDRKGILLHYKNDAIDIVTEASPLPGFSNESFEEVRRALLNQKEGIEEFLTDDITLQKIRNLDNDKRLNAPSIQFALSYLSLFILAEKKGKTIFDLFKTIPANSIQVNAVVGHGSIKKMELQILDSI
ncbi:MAG: hypothetical protein R3220_10495, partial [Balneolaceae bacterium]|nr:hypothetical protein [Balneolaceae bacterium]